MMSMVLIVLGTLVTVALSCDGYYYPHPGYYYFPQPPQPVQQPVNFPQTVTIQTTQGPVPNTSTGSPSRKKRDVSTDEHVSPLNHHDHPCCDKISAIGAVEVPSKLADDFIKKYASSISKNMPAKAQESDAQDILKDYKKLAFSGLSTEKDHSKTDEIISKKKKSVE